MKTVAALRALAICAALGLAACSGGGGGGFVPPPSAPGGASGGTSSGSQAAPTLSPSPSPVTTTASGVVYDLPNAGSASAPGWSVLAGGVPAAPGAPIAGADVYIGSAVVLGATAPAVKPAFASHATTAADGSFAIAGLVPGTYALTIFAPPPHVAIVHRDLRVAVGDGPGTYLVATLTPDESAWLAQQSADRTAYGVAALQVDEAALEAARYWSTFMAAHNYFGHCVPESLCSAGDTTPVPATYDPQDVDPQHRYAYFHGFSGGGEGENIAGGYATWALVDGAFMSEIASCPNATVKNCPFNDATGHFLNIIDPRYAWTGVAMATASTGAAFYDEEFTVVGSTLPTSARVRALHPDVRARKFYNKRP